jgi:hypothetical protein
VIVYIAAFAVTACGKDVIEVFAVVVDGLAVSIIVEVISIITGDTELSEEQKGTMLEDIS